VVSKPAGAAAAAHFGFLGLFFGLIADLDGGRCFDGAASKYGA
jgi:hypothetical protein